MHLPIVYDYDASTGMKGRTLQVPAPASVNVIANVLDESDRTNPNQCRKMNNSSNPNPNASHKNSGMDRERLKDMMADSFIRNETISILPGFKEEYNSHRCIQKPCIKLAQSNSATMSLTLGEKPPYAYTSCSTNPNPIPYPSPTTSHCHQGQGQSQGQGHYPIQNQNHIQNQGQWMSPHGQAYVHHNPNQNQNYPQEPVSFQYVPPPPPQHSFSSQQSGLSGACSDPTPWPYGKQKSHRSIRQAQAAYKLELDKQIEEKKQSQSREGHNIRKSLSSNSKPQNQPAGSTIGAGTKALNQSVSLEAFRNTGFLPPWFDPIRNNPLLYNNNPGQVSGDEQENSHAHEMMPMTVTEAQQIHQNQYRAQGQGQGQPIKPNVIGQYFGAPGSIPEPRQGQGSMSIDRQQGPIVCTPRSQSQIFESSTCGKYYIIPQDVINRLNAGSSSSPSHNVQIQNQQIQKSGPQYNNQQQQPVFAVPIPAPASPASPQQCNFNNVNVSQQSPQNQNPPNHHQHQQQQNNFWPPWLNLANLPPPPSPRQTSISLHQIPTQNPQHSTVAQVHNIPPVSFQEVDKHQNQYCSTSTSTTDVRGPVTLTESDETLVQAFAKNQNQRADEACLSGAPSQTQDHDRADVALAGDCINSPQRIGETEMCIPTGPGGSAQESLGQGQQLSISEQHEQGGVNLNVSDEDVIPFYANRGVPNPGEHGSGDSNGGMRIPMPHVSQTASQRPDEEVMKIHYKSELAKQIEDRKRLEEERAAKQAEEDAKFQRKIEQDQRLMVQEYEKEKMQHKLRQEEYRQRQEQIIKEKERFDREAENLKLKKLEERRQRLSSMAETPRRPTSKGNFSRSREPSTGETGVSSPSPYESPIDLTICAASKWATEARAKSPSNSKSESEETGSSTMSSSSSSTEQLPISVYQHQPSLSLVVNTSASVASASSLSGRSCGREIESPRPRTVVISQHRSSPLHFNRRSEAGVGGISLTTATAQNMSDLDRDSDHDPPPETSKSHPSALPDSSKQRSSNRERDYNNNGDTDTFLANVRKALLAEDNRMEEMIKRRERFFISF